jgi:hypothetical protein
MGVPAPCAASGTHRSATGARGQTAGLTARSGCATIRGTLSHHELRREHSYTAVIRRLRLLRPASVAETLVRFETPPGFQVQTDWVHLN